MDELTRLRAALTLIRDWEMPPKDAEGHSYGWNFGSNGERDLARNIAAAALGEAPVGWITEDAQAFVQRKLEGL